MTGAASKDRTAFLILVGLQLRYSGFLPLLLTHI